VRLVFWQWVIAELGDTAKRSQCNWTICSSLYCKVRRRAPVLRLRRTNLHSHNDLQGVTDSPTTQCASKNVTSAPLMSIQATVGKFFGNGGPVSYEHIQARPSFAMTRRCLGSVLQSSSMQLSSGRCLFNSQDHARCHKNFK
jgi:hypothetical protein